MTLGLSATAASAQTNEVWLWACHAPGATGEGIGDAFPDTSFDAFGEGCGGVFGSGGLRGALASDGENIAYGATASGSFTVRPNTKLQEVHLQRSAAGVATGVTYEAKINNAVVESADGADVAAAEKVFPVNAATAGGSVDLQLRCTLTSGCASATPATLDIGRIGMKVLDDVPPSIAVGNSRSPADKTLNLDVHGNDAGSGLYKAEAFVNGAKVNEKLFNSAASECRDLTPNDARVDMPLTASCVHVGPVPDNLPVDTTVFPDGTYELAVKVTDWAGNASTHTNTIEILNHVDLGTNTQQLNIGTSGVQTPQPNQNTNNNNSGVLGAQAQSCSSPRLSFSLSQKPMRIAKGRPVLQKNKRYRFTGRLTCVIKGKRVSAPKRTRVDIFNKVGRKTVERNGTTVGSKGRLSIILSYPSTRTIIFRFTNSDGKRSQVSIRVKVESKKKSTRR
jgi:hypothetical protein